MSHSQAETAKSNPFLPFGLKIYVALALAVMIGLQVFYIQNRVTYLDAQHVIDNDSLTRVTRVMDLHGDNSWWDTTMHRVNPPEGHTQHWTRLLDGILYGGSMIMAPFKGGDVFSNPKIRY